MSWLSQIWNILRIPSQIIGLGAIILLIIEISLKSIGKSIWRIITGLWKKKVMSKIWTIKLETSYKIKLPNNKGREDIKRITKNVLSEISPNEEHRWNDDLLKSEHKNEEGYELNFEIELKEDFSPMKKGEVEKVNNLPVSSLRIEVDTKSAFNNLNGMMDSIKTFSDILTDKLRETTKSNCTIEHVKFVIHTQKSFDAPRWVKEEAIESELFVKGPKNIDLTLHDQKIEFRSDKFYKSPTLMKYIRETVAMHYE